MQNNVRQYRKRAGLTLVRLAELSGVPKSTLEDIEQGADPQVSTAIRLAKALNTSVEKLWELHNSEFQKN